MIWAPLLHWYQPPNQEQEIILNVIRSSYDPIVSLLERYSRARVTLNINGSLTEQLAQIEPEITERVKSLVELGQIELVGAAKYHPLLPLIPREEIRRQIRLNQETNQRFFGDTYNPVGFFPTELAYNSKVADIVAEFGFKWMVLDEISLVGNLDEFGSERIYQHKEFPYLSLFFSDRQTSDVLKSAYQLDPKKFWEKTKKELREKNFLITVNDGEVFGHHYQSRENILEYAFEDPEIKTWTFSKLLYEYPSKSKKIVPKDGSWETESEDLENKNPYPLWNHPSNKIHNLQWRLTDLAVREYQKVDPPKDDLGLIYTGSRDHLDRGLHSCHYWWASASPWWNPDMVVKGATDLIKAVRGLPQVSKERKQKAEKLYTEIIKTTWEWHWGGRAQKMMHEYDRKTHWSGKLKEIEDSYGGERK